MTPSRRIDQTEPRPSDAVDFRDVARIDPCAPPAERLVGRQKASRADLGAALGSYVHD
ncbi:hypothetical protein [Caulobacter sp. 1776]|uniref:hypothetical protein n=1 Tax=Caulobacter sp. 1776 TaxID=3156420 RepID=UPI003392A1CF